VIVAVYAKIFLPSKDREETANCIFKAQSDVRTAMGVMSNGKMGSFVHVAEIAFD